MARRPKPWWRKERGEWCVTIRGTFHGLGPDEEEAQRKFHLLMAEKPIVSADPDAVVVVLDKFLAWNDAHRAARTQETYMRFLQPFAKSIGTILVDEIRTYHVQEFLDGMSGGDTTKNMAWRAINRAFNWAMKQQLMVHNPAAAVEKPASRIREDYVTEAEYAVIMANVPDTEFRDVLVTAWECGARPSEIFTVTAAQVEIDKARWHFQKGKRGLRRFIYLSADAEAITRRLMAEHPTGPLFRNTKGHQWDRHSVKCRFERLKGKVGRQVSLYLFRHSQITRQLASGMDSHVVAQLSGHKDTRMIDRVYSHVANDWEFMRDQLRGATPKGSGEEKEGS
jgi:integrase